jgi:hypothetical protein
MLAIVFIMTNLVTQNYCTAQSTTLKRVPNSSSEGSNPIIGKPITIGSFEVAQNDFKDSMSWDDAISACKALGEGWRLPTKNELNELFKNKTKIGGFENIGHWSSTEIGKDESWCQNFIGGSQYNNYKVNNEYVRAIRSL